MSANEQFDKLQQSGTPRTDHAEAYWKDTLGRNVDPDVWALGRLLERELGELRTKIEEAEGRCCPEDYGFEEYIGVLKRQIGERDVTIHNLTEAIKAMNHAPSAGGTSTPNLLGSNSLSAQETRQLIVIDDEVNALALHLCDSENEHPEGTQNRFLNDGLHSITFKEIAKRRVRVIVNRLAEMRRLSASAGGDGVKPKPGHCLLDIPQSTPCAMAGQCLTASATTPTADRANRQIAQSAICLEPAIATVQRKEP